MTQAYNLSQFANNADSAGKVSNSALTGLLPIANGGTNNASLGVTAGGIVYTDGSKLANVGAGVAGQTIISNAASAPTWGLLGVSSLTALASTSFSGVVTATISGLNLTSYDFILIEFQPVVASTTTTSIGGASTVAIAGSASSQFGSMYIDLNNGIQGGLTKNASTGGPGPPYNGITTYRKATTSISLTVGAGTITGTWQIWGLK